MSLERKILAGFIGSAVVMMAVSLYSLRNSAKLVATNEWVNHTHEVLYEFEQILAAAIDAETGMRGFVITGQESFLEPFSDSKARVQQHLSAVTNLTVDNSAQQQNVARLRESLDVMMKFRND